MVAIEHQYFYLEAKAKMAATEAASAAAVTACCHVIQESV